MISTPFFRKYLLPGFVFQSVVIAGGYGTGRELAEFFLPYGPRGGLLAMVLVSTVIWSAVCAASFAFAHQYRSYDYRSFFRHLLGRGWFLFEGLYAVQLLLVLAVIAAAAGQILRETFGLPYAVGVVGIMLAVGLLTFWGTAPIERFLARWSFVLYGVYLLFFGWCFSRFGDAITTNLATVEVAGGWVVGGVKYAAYNLAIIPPVLFVTRHIETRREALTAGALAGPIAIVPGVLFYMAMVGQYPAVVQQPVPANFLLELLGSPLMQYTFQIVLFGTLIETGTGLLHGVNERVAGAFAERERAMPAWLRPVVALGLLLAGALLARLGLVSLISRGYGTITWGFLAVFVVPILTWGVWKMRTRPPVTRPAPAPVDA